MNADLMPFNYEGHTVRTVVIDGEPWFVAADVARILGYRMASDMTRRLDSDDRGTRSVRTPSGQQDMTTINEPGLYEAVLGSQTTGARDFKRWVTHTVLPEIRRTGSFNAALPQTREERFALALTEAGQMLAERDERIAELEPKAEVADRLLDASGDYSVKDAADVLTRAGIKTGQARLFAVLEHKGWIHRAKGDGKWRCYAQSIETGYVAPLPQSHYHPKTGVLVLDPPQVRVTTKGLQRLLTEHGAQPVLTP
ncbi:antirepressor [Gordonia phage Blino]|uniref:Antirepressor n=1 Tax=Gordonia phage Blino TaxID=2793696 RepID=A0A7T0M262_9CAUD|nr:anti-repressor Ant [Gordonia phage CarolAnn]YP_010114138.1 anti-repressor Ant [Gordonia phage Blino]AOE44065.1 antirepressor [Gordonia phage CarolAnn]QPL13997.1 antirepressor [Gordonia phage Blino]